MQDKQKAQKKLRGKTAKQHSFVCNGLNEFFPAFPRVQQLRAEERKQPANGHRIIITLYFRSFPFCHQALHSTLRVERELRLMRSFLRNIKKSATPMATWGRMRSRNRNMTRDETNLRQQCKRVQWGRCAKAWDHHCQSSRHDCKVREREIQVIGKEFSKISKKN